MKSSLKKAEIKLTQIIHVFLVTISGHIIIFKRKHTRNWGPISGVIEYNENPISAAHRELKEEIGMSVNEIYSTKNTFQCMSPKGKYIYGVTCFAILSEDVNRITFFYNDEISRCLRLSPEDTLFILRKKGFPEAVKGFEYLMSTHLKRLRENPIERR